MAKSKTVNSQVELSLSSLYLFSKWLKAKTKTNKQKKKYDKNYANDCV